MQLRIDNLLEIDKIAEQFIKLVGNNRIFAFYGDMGAGKTTFINSILKVMGINDHSSSPTFSIVNEYLSDSYGTVYHFDFYRIENEMEALDIGLEDLIYGDDYCFMEWPERIENLLPQHTVNVTITIENKCRILDIDI